ncbi:hypothetical protein ESOMN_v1c04350 [Williamsoniiplasma somnilux]|uniref:Uncharacterized protein n=1 Tax=Williamsoniiplasma somnilux TaxID=215578 RepID=A0A2K8NYF0_9MOLU|nr:hypothetical protein [Williamsoniiplasma somnilux]ATZ18817.1 hypothetical protein ESOMN_v1c04350 [Williamsoniiplasma somnilux]
MWNKQDTIFWTQIESFLTEKNHDNYKKISLEDKKRIDHVFRITFFGIFQFELFKGKTIQSISPETVQEILSYLIKNYQELSCIVYHYQKKEIFFDVQNAEDVAKISNIFENLVVPYINEYSFIDVEKYSFQNNSKILLLLQMAFKNKWDINCKDDLGNITNSQIYPLLITLLIMDITNLDKMYTRIKTFFTKENIMKVIISGRELSFKETEHINNLLSLIQDDEDFHQFLVQFKKDIWEEMETEVRFKLVYQLSRFTSIFLKEKISSLVNQESELETWDLFYNYAPILLGVKTINTSKISNEKSLFLLPFLDKDFNSDFIYKHLKKFKPEINQEFNYQQLFNFSNSLMACNSFIRLICALNKDCPIISDFLIDNNKLALVDTLKLFEPSNQGGYKSNISWSDFEIPFISKFDLKEQFNDLKIFEDKNNVFCNMFKNLSLMLALNPEIINKFDYSFSEIVKYYILCFGPYENSKNIFTKEIFEELKIKLKNIILAYEKEYNTEPLNPKFKESFYLLYRLIIFKKSTK